VAPFVPKAGTPFQWLPMASPATLNHRLSLLKRSLPPQGVRLKWESPAWSEIQGVLARGDEKVAPVLANIKEATLAGWRQAVAECRLDVNFYAHERWETGKRLPWDIVDSGASPAHLELELRRALREV